MAFTPVQTLDLKLTGSGMSASDNSIVVQQLVKPGTETTITMSDFGSIGYGVIEPGTVREENFSFTGITQNANGTATFTGCVTGIDFVSPYSASASLEYGHAGNSLVRISNTAAFYSEFAVLENTQTFTGINTFPASGGASAARVASTAVAPALDAEFATKKYVDDTAIAGAPDATTTVKGIVEIATQAEVDAGTTTGATGASLAVRPPELANVIQDGSYIYAADSVGTDAYAITLVPATTAYVTGQVFNFKAGTANTGGATLNVNALGAKTILKNTDQALETGDIEIGSVVQVIYDGTNFQLQTPSAGSMTTSVVSQLSTGISANVTGTNLATLTAGSTSSGDALHTHTLSKRLATINNVTVAATSTETNLITFTLPANSLGTANAVRIRLLIQALGLNASESVSFLGYYDNTVMAQAAIVNGGADTDSMGGFIEFILTSSGATNTQRGGIVGMLIGETSGGQGTIDTANKTVSCYGAGTGAEDSTTALTVRLAVDFATTSVDNTIFISNGFAELIAG